MPVDGVVAHRKGRQPDQGRLDQLAGHPAAGVRIGQHLDVGPRGQSFVDDGDADPGVDQEVQLVVTQPDRNPDQVGDPVEANGGHASAVKSTSEAGTAALLTSA